jgi:hypothetical protein
VVSIERIEWVKLSTLTYSEIVNSIKTFETKVTKQDLMKSLDFLKL